MSRRPSGRLEAVQLMGMMDDMLEKAGVDEQSEELAELSQVGRQRNICSHAAFTWKNGPNLGKYQAILENIDISVASACSYKSAHLQPTFTSGVVSDVCSVLNLSVSSCCRLIFC